LSRAIPPFPKLIPAPTTVARRTLLQGGVAGALAISIVPACGMGAEPTLTGPAEAGNVNDLSVDTLKQIPNVNAFIGRDANGVYAMSAVCTHMGCLLGAAGTVESGAACGCHGSRFDGNGIVTHGPAGRNLQHYQVDIASDGTITVQGGIPVSDPATRTPAG
jgi:cytochrome b6-f complex iron-sulfur subunit